VANLWLGLQLLLLDRLADRMAADILDCDRRGPLHHGHAAPRRVDELDPFYDLLFNMLLAFVCCLPWRCWR
jgi:hypothetical protein